MVWRSDGVEQYPHSAAITAMAGLTGIASLLDDEDGEDVEEKRRRIEAEMEAKNFGAVVGLIAGTAMALKEQFDEQEQETHQQTMGGM